MNCYIPTFYQYITEGISDSKINFFREYLTESRSFNEATTSVYATRLLVENLLKKDGFSDEERLYLYVVMESNTSLYEWDVLNEGLLDKIKDIGSKAVSGGASFIKSVKDVVGKELSGIPEFFKALSSGVKNLAVHITEFLKKALSVMFGNPIEWAKKMLGGNYAKLEKSVTESAKSNPTKITEETGGVLQMVKGVPSLFSPANLGADIEKGLAKSDSVNVGETELQIVGEAVRTSVLLAIAEAVELHTVEEIKEGLSAMCTCINEEHGHTKIPFISTISGLLEKIPPFSWLTELANFFAKNVNGALTKLSAVMKEKGAIKEAMEFVVIGALVGLGLEYIVKTGAKSAIGYFFPPVHAAAVVLGTVATAICVVHVASTVIDGLKASDKEVMAAAGSISR